MVGPARQYMQVFIQGSPLRGNRSCLQAAGVENLAADSLVYGNCTTFGPGLEDIEEHGSKTRMLGLQRKRTSPFRFDGQAMVAGSRQPRHAGSDLVGQAIVHTPGSGFVHDVRDPVAGCRREIGQATIKWIQLTQVPVPVLVVPEPSGAAGFCRRTLSPR